MGDENHKKKKVNNCFTIIYEQAYKQKMTAPASIPPKPQSK